MGTIPAVPFRCCGCLYERLFFMSVEPTPVNPEDLGMDNRHAISKICSVAPDRWVVEEHEHRILTGNNDVILCADSAEPGKSRLGERLVPRRCCPLTDPSTVAEIAPSASLFGPQST